MHRLSEPSARPLDRLARRSARLTRIAGALTLSVLLGSASLMADGTVTGRARLERIKGNPSMGHVELYESNLFLCPEGGGLVGPSFRLGAPPGQAPRGDGFYSLRVPAGEWSILVSQPLFFLRPTVLSGVTVRDGVTVTQNVSCAVDYSTYFVDTWTVYSDTWLQTFTATGDSIVGVSWKLAGTNATEVEAAILSDNGSGDPSGWPLVSSRARKTDSVASITDNWVRWRSGEVSTVPGHRYAVRLRGVAGGDRRFAVFKRDKDANSYSAGRAHSGGGVPQNFDLNITVFSDNDGSAILMNKTTEGLGELRDGYYGGRWGQTFRATRGASLAAVDVWAAGADSNWDLDFTFRVFRGGVGGSPVGPVKTTRAAYQAFGAGLHGVSYTPGEVPLEPGETYYVEFTNPVGFNPYVMASAADAYSGGAAYQDRVLRDGGSVDLSMTVMVYTETGGTVEGTVVESASGTVVEGATVTLDPLGRSATTGAGGDYELRGVPAGQYTLRITKNGYTEQSISGVEVIVAETVRVDVSLSPAPCSLEFGNGGFESGLARWARYGDARNEIVDTSGGAWFGGIEAVEGRRFHGNAINGCCLEGGLRQSLCAIPGHRYRVSAWSNVYWLSGGADVARSRLGVDPGGGTDPDGPVVWSPYHRQLSEGEEGWRRLQVEVAATGRVLTIFLGFEQRSSGGNEWRINCFDLVEVEDLDGSSGPSFRRGDCTGDGLEDVADPVFLLFYLFGDEVSPGCDDACDANDDGAVDIADGIFQLRHLFLRGPAPPPPGSVCGPDGTPDDDLACQLSPCVP